MKSSVSWKTILLNTLITIALLVVFYWQGKSFFKEKLGYVKTGFIIREYKGMIAANEQFNNEMKQVQANLDTLRLRYEKLAGLEKMVATKEREDWAYRLGMARSEFEKYNQQAAEQMENRKQQLTGIVLEEINHFVQEYGKTNGYRFILGTTDNGSILHAQEADDLTTTVLQLLNEKHKDVPAQQGTGK